MKLQCFEFGTEMSELNRSLKSCTRSVLLQIDIESFTPIRICHGQVLADSEDWIANVKHLYKSII